MSRGFASNYRIVLLAIGLFGCFAAVCARLVCLHVLDRDELVKRIETTRRKTTVETARRGDILDASGATLATSRPMIRVAVDPWMARPEDEAKLPELATLLNVPLAEVREKLSRKYKPARNVTAAPNATAASSTSSLKVVLFAPTKPSVPAPAENEDEFGRAVVANNEAIPTTTVETERPASDVVDTSEKPGLDGRVRDRYVILSEDVTEATYAQIEKLKIRALCPPERRFARVYPHSELGSHVVGFANRENRGVAGIEAYADFYLRGQDGWREGEKDGRRKEVARFQTLEVPRSDGYSVKLSLDLAVQDIIEHELEKIAKTYEPLKATIIVSDPRTGFILGIANFPTFDPNHYNKVPKEEMARMKNVAVSDVYEPGSVFKIVAASAAIEENLVNSSTTFNCSVERIWYRDREMPLPKEDHRFDHPLSVAEIVAKSSNRGAAQLAMKLGEERFEAYARSFGFGRTLGFPVGGEVPGLFRPHEKWNRRDFMVLPMGHAIAATGLQMHQAMSVIANGGVLMRPQVIREVRDASNAPLYQFGPSELNRVISESTARTMASLLQRVASKDGTAPGAAIRIDGIDYEVAGKTGTAQKYIWATLPNGKRKLVPSTKNHVVSFVGFFPASRPQVAISVIVDDADHRAPNGVAYGSSVAAPVFKSIGEKLIPILSITPPNQPARIDMLAAKEGGRR